MAEAALWNGSPGLGGTAFDNDWFNGTNWNGGIVPGSAAGGTGTSGRQLGSFAEAPTMQLSTSMPAAYEVLNFPGLSIADGRRGPASETERLDILNGAQVNLTGGTAGI